MRIAATTPDAFRLWQAKKGEKLKLVSRCLTAVGACGLLGTGREARSGMGRAPVRYSDRGPSAPQ